MLAKAMDPPFVARVVCARSGLSTRGRPGSAAGAAARATADSAISAALLPCGSPSRSGRFVDEILWDAS